MWVFSVSLGLAVIAVISTFAPMQSSDAYGVWVAVLAYIVLAVSNLVETQRTPRVAKECNVQS